MKASLELEVGDLSAPIFLNRVLNDYHLPNFIEKGSEEDESDGVDLDVSNSSQMTCISEPSSSSSSSQQINSSQQFNSSQQSNSSQRSNTAVFECCEGQNCNTKPGFKMLMLMPCQHVSCCTNCYEKLKNESDVACPESNCGVLVETFFILK